MKVKIFILIFSFYTSQVLGSCDPTKCPPIPVHYDELGCKPVVNDGECCPFSFDCSHLSKQDDSKCHYKGNEIEAGSKVDESLTNPSCIGSAHCSSAGKFVYAHIDCAEMFGPPLQPDCVRQYSADKCCSTGTVCDDEALKLATCDFEGKTYKEGERMYPVDHKCYKCFCTRDFDNKTIIDNKNCQRVSCNIEILEGESVRSKCVPVYHPDSCCPYDWVCPKTDDGIRPGEHQHDNNSAPKCKFGNLEFEIGDVLTTAEKRCSKCSCNIPPMLDCVFQPGC